MLKYKLYLLLASVLVSSLIVGVEARPYWGNEDDDGSENDTAVKFDYVPPSDWADEQGDISKTVESDGSEWFRVFWTYDEKETESDHSNVRYSLWP